MEPHNNSIIKQSERSETFDVEKILSDSDKQLLNLIAEIIVKIIVEEEE